MDGSNLQLLFKGGGGSSICCLIGIFTRFLSSVAMGKSKRRVTQKRVMWNNRAKKRLKRRQLGRNKKFGSAEKFLEVGFWNVRTLTDERRENVASLVAKKGFDVLCLAETCSRSDAKADQFNLEGGNSKEGRRVITTHQGQSKGCSIYT